MSSLFYTYLKLGFEHISDINAYDHILFIVALCAIYTINEWKHILVLVTAFTIGHSVTLALASLDVVRFPSNIVEFLIPVTIFLTALFNLRQKDNYISEHTTIPVIDTYEKNNNMVASKKINLNYLIALFFGLIHGMGFSNFLRSSLMPGRESDLVKQLFAFNIGIELGQILIVFVILLLTFVALNIMKVNKRDWTILICGAAMGISVILMIETKFW